MDKLPWAFAKTKELEDIGVGAGTSAVPVVLLVTAPNMVLLVPVDFQ